jgi:hypothetical protein
LLKSGQAWQGGIELFNTYMLISGSRQGGQIKRAIPFGVQAQEGAGFVHAEHTGTPAIPWEVNPSKLLPPIYFPKPKPTPRINTASARRICGVSFIGILCDAIALF